MTCVAIPPLPPPGRLALPGGVTIEQHQILSATQPALAPILPMLQVVDAVLATFQCLQAIPQALGPPPDPSVLTSRLADLAKKADKLLRLVPQLSLPATVASTLDVLLGALAEAQQTLVGLERQTRRADEAAARGSELKDEALRQAVACARQNVDQEVKNLGAKLAALGKLIALVNLFGQLIGAPHVPDLSNASSLPLGTMLRSITELRGALASIREALPGV